MHALIEARRAAPAVLYLPHLQLWWQTAHASLRATLWMLLSDLPPDLPLLLLAVADCPLEVRRRRMHYSRIPTQRLESCQHVGGALLPNC